MRLCMPTSGCDVYLLTIVQTGWLYRHTCVSLGFNSESLPGPGSFASRLVYYDVTRFKKQTTAKDRPSFLSWLLEFLTSRMHLCSGYYLWGPLRIERKYPFSEASIYAISPNAYLIIIYLFLFSFPLSLYNPILTLVYSQYNPNINYKPKSLTPTKP